MLTYILIGCFVAVITDFIAYSMMGNREVNFISAAFIAVFWPMVVIYLVVFLVGELFEAIGCIGRKKGG